MNEINKAYKQYILNKEHHALRTEKAPDPTLFTSGEYHKRMKNRFISLLSLQDPVFIENELFIPTRTCVADPDILTANDPTPEKMHERGWLSNVCPDYERAVSLGLLALKTKSSQMRKRPMIKKKRCTPTLFARCLTQSWIFPTDMRKQREKAEETILPKYFLLFPDTEQLHSAKRFNPSESFISACGLREITT
jgi:hypothetical protein